MAELTENQIKDAIKKDFNELYVKEFSTMWELERMVRGVEIDIMSIKNLMELIAKPPKGLVLEHGCSYLNSELECEKGLLLYSKCPHNCVYYDDGSQ